MADHDRLRFGVLGAANIARKAFVPGAALVPNAVVTAVASREPGRAAAFAAEAGIAKSYGSYEELLADPDVDAIYNPLPNSLHAEWTLRAARAGKHVLCEKPLAVDAAEAQAMIDGCREAGVVLMEAFMYRFHPQQRRVRELIDQGAIGEIRFVRASFNFNIEPFPAHNVRLRADLAGGALMDVGCYCVNAARMLFGEEPQWASAQWDFRENFGVEVSLAGTLGFSDGRTAIFDCGFRAWGQGSYAVAGTKGAIELPNAFVPRSDVVLYVAGADGRREERIEAVDQYALETREFASAVLERRPLAIPAEDALGTLRAIEALHRSARAGGERCAVERTTLRN